MADENVVVDPVQDDPTPEPTPDPPVVNPLLVMLKTDLGISTTLYDTRLGQYLDSAKAAIEREGYTFPSSLSVDEMQTIVMHAAEQWQSRGDNLGTPRDTMSRKLRYHLNSMIFQQKIGEESND